MSRAHNIFLTAFLRSCLLRVLFSVVKENVKVTELRGTGVSLRSCSRRELQMVSERKKQRSTYPPEVLIFISSPLPSPPAPSLTPRAPWVCFPNNPTIIRLSRTWLLSGRLYSFLGN